MSLFAGLSAFPITPADEKGHVDTDNLAHLVQRLVTAKVGSVGLLGSTGSYAYLDRAERLRAIRTAAETVNGALPLIAGVGALRTSDAIALARDAKGAGADALLLAPVSYTPLTADEVFTHFSAVAAATDLPLCIYNNPGTTHFNFDLPLLARLAGLPTIAAVKMPLPVSTGLAEDLATLRDHLPDGFCIGYSADWGCAEALLAGADTWYSVIGGILPQIAQDLTTAARSGDVAKATALNDILKPLWMLFQEFGSLRVVYVIAQHLRLTKAMPPRPVLPLGTEAQARIITALDGLV